MEPNPQLQTLGARTVAVIAIPIALALVVGYLSHPLIPWPIDLARLHPWATIAGVGAFGGVIYGARAGEVKRLQMERDKIQLGWVGDCLFGVAGGYAVFLIVPGKFDIDPLQGLECVKMVAVAMIGGYGAER